MVCLFLLTSLQCFCSFITDDSDVQIITQQLEKFRNNYPQEKIYLQSDKPYYSIGDTIFFKAYVVNAEKNTPSVISNIVHVDLIDGNNHLQKTLVLPLANGITEATIGLSDTLQEGNYQLRAYTNWMRNFDEDWFFNKTIQIGNALNDHIQVHSNFIFDSVNNNKNSVDIAYTSINNNEVKSKNVSYAIMQNGKEIENGKSITNNEGIFSIDLSQLQKNQTYELVTNIKTDNKTAITKRTKFYIPASAYSIQFFPEGGQMVNGLPAHIGVKAMSANGAGISVSGEITDENGNQSGTFKSAFAGIGSFTFTPQHGHLYKALVKYKNGTIEKIDLPKAEDEGYILSIENKNWEKLNVTVSAKGTPAKNVILSAQCNSRILTIEKLSLINGNAAVSVLKKKLPAGIIQFTLFDAALKPVAERLVFINHDDHLQISLTPDKTVYNKRERVKMILEVKDDIGDPVSGSFSLAVTNGNSIQFDKSNGQTILTNLLLTSDIKGYVESPGYYFSGVDESKTKALDNLMLTQGWRRFIWKDILANNYPATTFKAEKSLEISGKITTSNGEPSSKAKVTLLSKKGDGFVADTIANEDGSFSFDRLYFRDSMPFVIKAVTAKGSSDVVIKLNEFSSPFIKNNYSPAIINVSDTAITEYLSDSRKRFVEMRKNGWTNGKSITLKEVKVTAKKLSKVEEAVAPSANLNGPGKADQVLTYLDMPNCKDLSVCLPGKLRGVLFKTVVMKGIISTIPYSTMGMGEPMLIIVDGQDMSFSDGQFSLKSIPAGDVQSIEILRSGAYTATYGFRGSGGVMLITTKHGGIDYNGIDDAKKQTKDAAKAMLFGSAQGFSTSREFYSPSYNAENITNATPDLRSTIYWKPDILTDNEGKATIEFYNADVSGKYNVIIEGISGDGKIGSETFIYDVAK